MSTNFSSVVKIIKNYVSTCGGDVTLPELVEDYHTSFNSDIPFQKFGHTTLIDFLMSITGLSIVVINDEYHIKSRWAKNAGEPKPARSTLSPDMSLLCVEMKNNLLLPSSDAKRKVTVKTGNSVKCPEKQTLKRYNSFYSVSSEDRFDLLNSSYCARNSSSRSSCHELSPGTRTRISSPNSLELNDYFTAANVDSYLNSPVGNNEYSSEFLPQPIPRSPLNGSSFAYQSQPTDTNLSYDDYQKPLFVHRESFLASNALYSPVNPPECNNSVPKQSPVQVINRLVALVNAQQEMTTSKAIEFSYIDSYCDVLPQNWLTLLDESNLLYIEHLESGVIIYPTRMFSSAPTLTELPKLELPDQMPWSVDIAGVRSTDSIWFRLKENDLDRRYQILCQEMRKHYQDLIPGEVTAVRNHQLFVVRLKGKMMRVCVLHQEKEMYKCLAIDEGLIESVSLKSFYHLHEKFTNTPKLILQGSLLGLNKYAECQHVQRTLEKMVIGEDTSLIVEKMEGGKFMINLCVTKVYERINVNEYLLDMIKKELTLPKFEINKMYDVIVLSMSEDVAKVHVMSLCYELLQETLQKCKHIINCTDRRLLYAKNLIDIQINQLYLARYSDGSWQRVLIKQFINSTHVVVLFVDFQEFQALPVTTIIRFSDFPDTLAYIPPQAVSVNVVETDHKVLKLMNLKQKLNLFSMKIVKTNPQIYVQMFSKVCEEPTIQRKFINTDFEKFCCTSV